VRDVALAEAPTVELNAAEFDRIVADIRRSRKYSDLCPTTIRDVVGLELDKHKSIPTAIAAARRRLHRLWAEFLGAPNFDNSCAQLQSAFASNDDPTIKTICRQILSEHASTRERLDDLPEFYQQLFTLTGVPTSLHDLASAFHPFGFRWMGLPRSVRYCAYDINARTVWLTNCYFQFEGIAGAAEHCDVLCDPPREPADLALLLKMYHCLERRRRGAGWQALAEVPARWVTVSFPTRNLQGRYVDIAGNYESEIRERATSRGWTVSHCGVPSETVLVIHKE
jgi:16S rRNA (guanine(1405)-N(7))-methyltransferase